MRSIVYVSIANGPVNKSVLRKLLYTSRRNNEIYGVTGILLYYDSTFIQAIEGEEDTIEQLIKNIKSDPRHRSFEVISDVKIEEREFNSWFMGFRAHHSSPLNSELPLEEVSTLLSGSKGVASDLLRQFYDFNIASGMIKTIVT